ncbi:MAG: hypothetical protein AB4426_00915 [Xenococcaceae cyanobacterium]
MTNLKSHVGSDRHLLHITSTNFDNLWEQSAFIIIIVGWAMLIKMLSITSTSELGWWAFPFIAQQGFEIGVGNAYPTGYRPSAIARISPG